MPGRPSWVIRALAEEIRNKSIGLSDGGAFRSCRTKSAPMRKPPLPASIGCPAASGPDSGQLGAESSQLATRLNVDIICALGWPEGLPEGLPELAESLIGGWTGPDFGLGILQYHHSRNIRVGQCLKAGYSGRCLRQPCRPSARPVRST